MHSVYILQSKKNGRYYVGVTNNVKKWLEEHNSGWVKSTAPYRPWVLMRVEQFSDEGLAYKRERFIKAKRSRQIIGKIISSQT